MKALMFKNLWLNALMLYLMGIISLALLAYAGKTLLSLL